MGAKVSVIQGIVPVTIKAGKMYVTDKLGVVHTADIKTDIEVDNDTEFFPDLYFVNIKQGNNRLVCRYDGTWTLVHEPSKLLLDMGAFKLDNMDILRTEYMPIGSYVYQDTVAPILLDMNNKILAHVVLNVNMPAVVDLKFDKPFIYDVDLVRAASEAHNRINLSSDNIYIYVEKGKFETEGVLHEISRTIPKI